MLKIIRRAYCGESKALTLKQNHSIIPDLELVK